MTSPPAFDGAPTPFPITIRLRSAKTDEIVWSRTVTLLEARICETIDVPTFSDTEHAPVVAVVTDANEEHCGAEFTYAEHAGWPRTIQLPVRQFLVPRAERWQEVPLAAPTKPTMRRDFTPDMFPITFRLFSGKTGEVVWSRTVTLADARSIAKIDIPSYAGTEHYPVRAEITYADGTTDVGGMS